MTLGAIAAVICLIVGFAVGIFADGRADEFLFDSLTWFVAAIPCALLGGPVVYPRGRGGTS